MSDWESEEMRRSRLFVIGVATASGGLLLLPLPLRRATRAAVIGGLKSGIVPRCIMSFRSHAGRVWCSGSCGSKSHVAEPDGCNGLSDQRRQV
jgi:hypothetical protein